MPYYIYRVTEQPIKMLSKLEQHDTYRDAAARTKQLRIEMPSEAEYIIKMIFAENEFNAEDLLNQVREPNLEPDD